MIKCYGCDKPLTQKEIETYEQHCDECESELRADLSEQDQIKSGE